MVESTRLESEHTGNRIVGSNPTLSAIPLGVSGSHDAQLWRPRRQGYGKSTVVLD